MFNVDCRLWIQEVRMQLSEMPRCVTTLCTFVLVSLMLYMAINVANLVCNRTAVDFFFCLSISVSTVLFQMAAVEFRFGKMVISSTMVFKTICICRHDIHWWSAFYSEIQCQRSCGCCVDHVLRIRCSIIVFHFSGQFCPLGVPEHDAFMNAIMKGNKPASLQAGTVVLSDHRHEEYKPTGQAAEPAVQ